VVTHSKHGVELSALAYNTRILCALPQHSLERFADPMDSSATYALADDARSISLVDPMDAAGLHANSPHSVIFSTPALNSAPFNRRASNSGRFLARGSESIVGLADRYHTSPCLAVTVDPPSRIAFTFNPGT